MFLERRAKLLLFLVCLVALAPTLIDTGNWSDSSNWSGGDIGDAITEDVTMNNNTGTITIQNGESFIIGQLDMQNGNTLTIDAGGSLTVGSSSDINNLITSNGTVINVDGDLEIWGDLVVNNNLTLNVTGTLIIHGDVNMGNNASLDIQGDVTVEGDFNGGNNTDVNVDGTLDIDGNIDVGNGSDLTGSGTVDVAGTCSGPPTFCASGPLPIELLFFNAQVVDNYVLLTWATASEEDFDFFSVERSEDGREFYEIASVPGNGFSDGIINYNYQDPVPKPGRFFYRLKAVDFDGSFEYFEIKSVIINKIGIEVFPNPVYEEQFNVWVNFDNNQPILLKILDVQGKVISKHQLQRGSNEVFVKKRTPGVYLLVFQSGALNHYRKLILQ